MLNDHFNLKRVTLDGVEYTIFPESFYHVTNGKSGERNNVYQAMLTVPPYDKGYSLKDKLSCLIGPANVLALVHSRTNNYFVLRKYARFASTMDYDWSRPNRVTVIVELNTNPVFETYAIDKVARIMKIEAAIKNIHTNLEV